MFRTRRLVQVGFLTAFGAVLEVFFNISMFPPPFDFFKLAPGDIPLLWVGYAFGPLWGVVSVAVKAVLFTLMTGIGGAWGTLMHFLASSAFVVVFSLFARRKSKSLIPTFLGLSLGLLARTGIMIPANLLITPIYLNATVDQVKKMIIPYIIPFNLLHGGINSTLFVLMRLALGDKLSSYLLKK